MHVLLIKYILKLWTGVFIFHAWLVYKMNFCAVHMCFYRCSRYDHSALSGWGGKKKNQTGRNKRNRTISRKHLFKSGNKSCKLRGIMWKLCYNLLNCWQCNTANAISVIIIIKYPFSSDFKQKCIVWADQTVYALNVSQDILEPSRLPGMSTTLSSAKWICRISVRKGRQNV